MKRSALAVSVVVAALIAFGGVAPAAFADTSYPSWDDVQAAKASQAATQAEVNKISGILDQLQTAVNKAADEAVARAAEYAQAQADLKAATDKADKLDSQAKAATSKADELRQRSGQLTEQLSRSGGANLTVNLFLSGKSSSNLLYQLGAMSKLSQQAGSLFAQATTQRNLARSLSEQADVAKTARDKLAKAAQTSLQAAQAAEQAADDQLVVQQKASTQLTAQLASLKNTTAAVEQKYEQGVAAQKAIEEQQREAEENAAAAPSGGGGGSSGSGGGGDGTAPDGSPGTAPPPDGMDVDPAAAQAYAASRLGSYGWGGDQMNCLISLWNQESGWRADAYNASSEAYGIPQSLPGSKMETAGSDWRTNANTQINWGLSYISSSYGSPCGAWNHEIGWNWY